MPRYLVTLGRMVRETATVVVDVESEKELEARLSDVYEAYDDSNWEADSHTIDGEASKKSLTNVTLEKEET